MSRAAAAPRPQLLALALRESAGVPGKVDRAAGVIRGVKLIGRSSPNTHGVAGVDGTLYTPEALKGAARLYEGAKVNVDHPPKARPGEVRSAHDRFAWVENVRVTESGLFGDLHFLDPTDPLATKVMTAAEECPDAYALSHNAYGKGEVRGGKFVVREIPEVRSVDLVSEGGSNRSLFEAKEVKTTSLRRLILESASLTPATRKRLLEAGAADMLDRDLPEADEPGGGDGESDDYRDHMLKGIGSLVKSDDPADHDMAAKHMKLMRPVEEEDEPEEQKEGDDEGESQAARGKPEKDKANDKDDGEGKESMESRQRRAKRRIELAGLSASADLVESLASVPSRSWDSILYAAKQAAGEKAAPGGRGAAPRSAPAGGVPLHESRDTPKDAEGWAKRLLRG